MKIHHIGIACSNIEEAITEFGKFHTIVRRTETIFDELQHAMLCMVYTDTGLDVEFVAGDQVTRLVKKGMTYYHLCYQVMDLEAQISDCLEKGAMMISEPKPAVLFGGKRVAFVYMPYGLVEFLEQ